MILLFEVHQLVNEHVIANGVRRLHQPEVQGNCAGVRARPPPRPLIANADALHRQRLLAREFEKTRNQFTLGNGAQTFFGDRPKVQWNLTKPGAMSADVQPRRGAIPDDAQAYVLTTQQNLVALDPLRGRMLGKNAHPFAFRPRAVFTEERLGLAARTPSRNGDAERTIRLHANDVASRGASSHEVDGRSGRRRFDAQEWQAELHP